MQFPGSCRHYGVQILTRYHASIVFVAARIPFGPVASPLLDNILGAFQVIFVDITNRWYFNSRNVEENLDQPCPPPPDSDKTNAHRFLSRLERLSHGSGAGQLQELTTLVIAKHENL